MKDMNISYGRLILATFLLLLVFSCNKDDDGTAAVKTGNWSGTDINFSVGGSPLKVSNLEFAYSGHAAGTACSFDYESTASFASVISIQGNSFEAQLSTFEITGTFLTDSTAVVEITWAAYDSNCDAYYYGDRTYTASLESGS